VIPVSLHLKNFLSYGEAADTLDFTQFRLACLSGPNGHGKSALLDAMTWAVWGQARKGGAAGKPESGLLRIGARHMQVEFVFDLGDRRYRIIRQYEIRKTGTEKRDLQFQCWNPECGEYQPLTRQRATDTQKLIQQTLRMDYDTFINSSFLLQGRADEFTRKKSRERKEILAEILGLSHYEALQQQARQRYRELEKTLSRAEHRREDIERELEARPEVEQKHDKVSGELERVRAECKAGDEEVQRLSAKKEEIERLKIQAKEGRGRLALHEKEERRLGAQVEPLGKQLQSYRRLLETREKVEQRWRRYGELEIRMKRLTEKLQERATLEQRRAELERQFEREKSRLAQEHVRLTEERKAVEARLAELGVLLARREEIALGVKALAEGKAAIQGLEQGRDKRSRIEKEIEAVRREIEQAKSEIEIQKARLETEAASHRKKLSREQEILRATEAIEKRLEQFGALEKQQEEVLEKGQALKSQCDLLERTVEDLKVQISQQEEKLALLRQSREASCPLCESRLDESRRTGLLDKLAEELGRLGKDREDREKQLKAAREDRRRERLEYQKLQERLAGREQAQAERGRLAGELRDVEQGKQQSVETDSQIAELARRLSEGLYAQERKEQHRRLQKQLEETPFDSGRLDAFRQKQEQLSGFPAEQKRLEEAAATRELLEQQQTQLEGRIKALASILSREDFLPDVRRALHEANHRLEAIGYDRGEHERIEHERIRLANAPAEQALLEEAVKQAPEIERQLQEAEEALAKNRSESGRLKKQLAALESGLGAARETAEALAAAEERRSRLAAERDRLNVELGTLEREKHRLKQMEKEKEDLAGQSATETEEKRLYDILVEALGPNGVQALIIENAIPEIQDEANRILARLTGGRTQVALESLREKKTGGAIETLDIKISDEMGTRDYEMFSGGESFRTDLAVRIALSRLLARRAGTRLQTLVIDEGFGTQDMEGLDNIVQVIRDIAEEFEKILVITHLDSLKSAFPVRIEVTKHPEKGSTFEVIHN